MVSIRSAAHADVGLIRSLAEKVWWPVYRPILQDEQIQFMLNQLYSEKNLANSMNNGETFLLLHDKNGYQGFVSYSLWTGEVSCWKVNKLYVLPENHGSGYGRRLMNEVTERARQAGIGNLVLNVNRHNPALHFYKKLGFAVVGEEDVPIGPYWMNDYVMKIAL